MAVYSHSRLSTFEECPRQYFYKYVAGIKIEEGPPPAYLTLGNCVHETLEEAYKTVGSGRVPTVKELVADYERRWREACREAAPVAEKGQILAGYCRTGARMLTAYHGQYAPFDGARLIGLEKEVRIDLNGDGRYKFVGYIDRLNQRYDGTYEIHDYKTSKHLPTQGELDSDRQLALYHIGLSQMWKDVDKVELVWHYLRHEKELRSTRTPKQLDELKLQTIDLIDAIESRGRDESRYDTCENGLCDWCDYQHVCPVRKHLFKTAEMPANRFLKDSGVKLVNRHAKLTAEIDALQGQIDERKAKREEVNEALLAYAEREGLEIIVGSNREAKVSEKTEIILPTKGESPDEYAKLEAKLRRSPSWSEVSTLDPHTLRRIWKDEQEDPGGVKKIVKPYVRENNARTVRVRERKEK